MDVGLTYIAAESGCVCEEAGKVWVQHKNRCEFSVEEDCPGEYEEKNNKCMRFVSGEECGLENCDICHWIKERLPVNDHTSMEEKMCKQCREGTVWYMDKCVDETMKPEGHFEWCPDHF